MPSEGTPQAEARQQNKIFCCKQILFSNHLPSLYPSETILQSCLKGNSEQQQLCSGCTQ